eukprot:8542580-Ditylum_brightwellii.AAC.1
MEVSSPLHRYSGTSYRSATLTVDELPKGTSLYRYQLMYKVECHGPQYIPEEIRNGCTSLWRTFPFDQCNISSCWDSIIVQNTNQKWGSDYYFLNELNETAFILRILEAVNNYKNETCDLIAAGNLLHTFGEIYSAFLQPADLSKRAFKVTLGKGCLEHVTTALINNELEGSDDRVVLLAIVCIAIIGKFPHMALDDDMYTKLINTINLSQVVIRDLVDCGLGPFGKMHCDVVVKGLCMLLNKATVHKPRHWFQTYLLMVSCQSVDTHSDNSKPPEWCGLKGLSKERNIERMKHTSDDDWLEMKDLLHVNTYIRQTVECIGIKLRSLRQSPKKRNVLAKALHQFFGSDPDLFLVNKDLLKYISSETLIVAHEPAFHAACKLYLEEYRLFYKDKNKIKSGEKK